MEAAASTTEQAVPPPRLRETYREEVLPSLIEKFGYTTPMRAPRLEKITLNMGHGSHMDTKSREKATEELAIIAGQAPNVRVAKKSIASFKVREGMPVGASVTLRGARMWEFLDRLCSIAIPRIRDFRGLKATSFDGRGNYSMGVKEQLIFPEIDYDSVDETHGLDITITTTAPTDVEAFELLLALGMPFAEEGRPLMEGSAEAAAAEAAAAEAERLAEEAKKEEAARQAEAAEIIAAQKPDKPADAEEGEEGEDGDQDGADGAKDNTDTEAQEG